MNEIIARTNSGEYAGGSTIYGAVYLRLLEPVVADTINISFVGQESCRWRKIVANLGQTMVRTRSTSQNSTDTGFCEPNEPNAADLSFREVVFSGNFTHLKFQVKLKQYKDGVIPLGCYAFPFQFSLRQGLPNSFKKEETIDEIKRTTYSAQISYELSAMLQNAKSRSKSNIMCSNTVVLRNEGFMKRTNTKVTKSTCQTIKGCCWFDKGDILLSVTLDKELFTLGESIHVRFQVDNKTEVKISTARIKLMKTIKVKGSRTDDEGKTHESTETFFEEDRIVVPLEMGNNKSKSFDAPIPLKQNKNEAVATSMGSVVKCRYQLEVELDVPLDNDISVIIPIEVYPNTTEDWKIWTPPDWIKDVQVVDTEGMCAVQRHILESTKFSNIPLPLAGLNSSRTHVTEPDDFEN